MIPVARNVWQHVDGGSSRRCCPTLDHRQDHPSLKRPARQPAPRRVHALEERRLRLLEPGRRDVGVEGRGRPVVGRYVVPLPALLVEPQPAPAPLPEVVLPPHPQHRAHPREAVEHHRQERPVPEPGQGAPVSIDSRSFLASAAERTGVAPLVTTCFGPRTAAAGFTGKDLADDEPVAEHADRGQVLLHCRGRSRVRPDVGGHVERRDVAQPEPSRPAPPEELPHRPPVRRPRPRVRDPSGEELQEPRRGLGPRVDDHLLEMSLVQ